MRCVMGLKPSGRDPCSIYESLAPGAQLPYSVISVIVGLSIRNVPMNISSGVIDPDAIKKSSFADQSFTVPDKEYFLLPSSLAAVALSICASTTTVGEEMTYLLDEPFGASISTNPRATKKAAVCPSTVSIFLKENSEPLNGAAFPRSDLPHVSTLLIACWGAISLDS